jgi:hypothetical protein
LPGACRQATSAAGGSSNDPTPKNFRLFLVRYVAIDGLATIREFAIHFPDDPIRRAFATIGPVARRLASGQGDCSGFL